MAIRFNVVLSDDMGDELERIASENETTKGEVLRRAFSLYLAARAGHRRGMVVGLADPTTRELKAEFVGM